MDNNKRTVPANHPALDKFYEFIRNNGVTPSMKLYTYYMLEAIREGSLWEVNVGENKYEVYADVLETRE